MRIVESQSLHSKMPTVRYKFCILLIVLSSCDVYDVINARIAYAYAFIAQLTDDLTAVTWCCCRPACTVLALLSPI
jgi:hypothetical protein